MSKRDDAFNRLSELISSRFFGSAPGLTEDIRLLLAAYEDFEVEHEILHDLVQDECEKRAIGGGPNWKERHEKTWARAFELFEGGD